ncbi:transposase family protein [Actinomycetes bacterium KLBMP 9797]
MLVLAHLRYGDTCARLPAGFGVGLATAFRYIREAVDLLADRAPSLTAALWRLTGNGHRSGILDGTVVRIDRLDGDLNRLYYSGNHHHDGINLQGLVDPRCGDPVWISDGLPGDGADHGSVPVDLADRSAGVGTAAAAVPTARSGSIR